MFFDCAFNSNVILQNPQRFREIFREILAIQQQIKEEESKAKAAAVAPNAISSSTSALTPVAAPAPISSSVSAFTTTVAPVSAQKKTEVKEFIQDIQSYQAHLEKIDAGSKKKQQDEVQEWIEEVEEDHRNRGFSPIGPSTTEQSSDQEVAALTSRPQSAASSALSSRPSSSAMTLTSPEPESDHEVADITRRPLSTISSSSTISRPSSSAMNILTSPEPSDDERSRDVKRHKSESASKK